jgi:hypothetical protein
MLTSTSKTRLRRSASGAMRVIWPRNSRPGCASVVTRCWLPILSSFSKVSVAPKTTFTLVVSARMNPGVPGPTSEPTSTSFFTTTPSIGDFKAESPSASCASRIMAEAPATLACTIS